MVLHSEALTMDSTCKNVAPSLNVGTVVNASLCSRIYLCKPFLCHPYILTICRIFFISSFCTFIVYSYVARKAVDTCTHNHRTLVQVLDFTSVTLELKVWASTQACVIMKKCYNDILQYSYQIIPILDIITIIADVSEATIM